MKINTIITVTNNPNHPGVERLTKSAEKFGWELYVIDAQWKGFGTKLIETYNFLINNPQIERFVFVDAHDVVVLSDPETFNSVLSWYNKENKMLVSCEKACWPDSSLSKQYTHSDSEWKYVNSGLYYAPSDIFIKVFESSRPEYHDDDQLWLSKRYLDDKTNCKVSLDDCCSLFQSYSHIADNDFAYRDGLLINLKTNTAPIFIHGNGRTDMTLIDQLL
jgi:hypothetical protein